jgi:cobalt-zinc-cadmium efflux system outer membrane protein
MLRRWFPRATIALWLACAGCAHLETGPEYARVVENLNFAAHRPPESVRPDDPDAVVLDPAPTPPELLGPQPVDAFISHALAENRTVQAARFNLLSMKERIPQVTALDDPVVSNTIYPIPSVAPQYSLMGYNPYNLMIAQQFPWCGTLRLRGQAAEEDVKVALAELCAAELDVISAVKRAYYDLSFNDQAEKILLDNRKLASDFITIAKARYTTGNTGQQDVLRAEVVVSDLDRELIRVRQGLAEARADLAQQLHINPESDLRTRPTEAFASVPAEVDRLYRLAVASRPELRGRLAAIARDERAVELARKRYYPNLTLGLSYMDMEKTNATTPRTASGFPNVGLFVCFNLPVYHKKLAAGVAEAQARTVADAKLYDAERDSTYREIKDLLTQSKAQHDILDLFRVSILPKAEQALEAATSDYRAGNVDYVTLITAWREVLQIQLQVAQVEAELGKALAALERAVGIQLNAHPPTPGSAPDTSPTSIPIPTPPAPAPASLGPFRQPPIQDPSPAPLVNSRS